MQKKAIVITVFIFAAFIATFASMISASTGCGPVKEVSRDVAGNVVDCGATQLGELVAHVLPFVQSAIKAATQPDGRIEWSHVRALVDQSTDGTPYAPGKPLPVGVQIIGCAVAATVGEAPAAPTASLIPAITAEAVRSDWEGLRAYAFGGYRFKTAAGTF